jgi:nucleoside-diphosphate-sugar epimerase
MSAFIVGSTGLCGNFILKHSPDYFNKVFSLSRSTPANSESDKITVTTEKDTTQWGNKIKDLDEGELDVFFSGLGTTRAKAGGIANQYKIDHDLNLELAKAAKEKGFKKYVLISSLGSSATSVFPYLKMKGQLEENVLKLGFEQTIIVRPGALLGERTEDKGFLNNAAAKFGGWIHGTPVAKFLGSPVFGEEVALACLKASKEGYADKVVYIDGADVAILAHK